MKFAHRNTSAVGWKEKKENGLPLRAAPGDASFYRNGWMQFARMELVFRPRPRPGAPKWSKLETLGNGCQCVLVCVRVKFVRTRNRCTLRPNRETPEKMYESPFSLMEKEMCICKSGWPEINAQLLMNDRLNQKKKTIRLRRKFKKQLQPNAKERNVFWILLPVRLSDKEREENQMCDRNCVTFVCPGWEVPNYGQPFFLKPPFEARKRSSSSSSYLPCVWFITFHLLVILTKVQSWSADIIVVTGLPRPNTHTNHHSHFVSSVE